MLDKKILAFQVELGELANELPEVFKFWSNKKNNYEKALKEYVDGLHFLLSIGNDLKMKNYNYYAVDSPLNQSLVDTFTSLMTDAEALMELDYKNSYLFIMNRFLSLGEQLGFTTDQMEQAYYDKNKINHERQAKNY